MEKKSKAEKAIESAVEAFAKYQKDAEERFQRYEEERWRKEIELENRRRQEDRNHEIQMMTMLGHMLQGRRNYSEPHTGDEY